MENKLYELIIIGSGPAGFTAAIYASRARLNPLLLAGSIWGGQLMNTTEVENYPGFPESVDGPDLMNKMLKQAERFGTEIKYEDVTKVDFSGDVKKVYANNVEYQAKAVIIASGATPKKLEVPGEDRLWGKGVSSCATCDGAFFRDKVIAVVGGGDSAMEEASFLTRFASKVYVIHRREEFRASKIMQEEVFNNPKVEVIFNTEVKEILGEMKVQKVKLFNNKEDREYELDLDGVFLAVGHIPMTNFLGDTLKLDDKNYVIAEKEIYTNIDGIFVAGDVEDQMFRQAITAAASGCKAAIAAERWLAMNSH